MIRSINSFYKKIDKLDIFIFDFDGTLYPGLLLLDLGNTYLKNSTDKLSKEKYSKLLTLIATQNNYAPTELHNLFVELLNGIPTPDFYRPLDQYLSNIYPNAVNFIQKLTDMGKTCYLSSLTTEYIAKAVSKKLGFKKYYCRDIRTKLTTHRKPVFLGKFENCDIQNLAAYKENCLSYFNVDEPYLMVGDSFEDYSLLSNAHCKCLVNPESNLSDILLPDCVFSKRPDPWVELIPFNSQ